MLRHLFLLRVEHNHGFAGGHNLGSGEDLPCPGHWQDLARSKDFAEDFCLSTLVQLLVHRCGFTRRVANCTTDLVLVLRLDALSHDCHRQGLLGIVDYLTAVEVVAVGLRPRYFLE